MPVCGFLVYPPEDVGDCRLRNIVIVPIAVYGTHNGKNIVTRRAVTMRRPRDRRIY
jgi:hypothetical protein